MTSDIPYFTSFASNSICVPTSACDTGHPFFAPSACSLNVFSSIPGISASVSRWMRVI